MHKSNKTICQEPSKLSRVRVQETTYKRSKYKELKQDNNFMTSSLGQGPKANVIHLRLIPKGQTRTYP